MGCLSQDTVVALLEGRLDEDATRSVDDHIDTCATCRTLVAEVARGSMVVHRSLPEPEPAAEGEGDGAELLPGQLLADRFRIVRRIGKGGMGVVWEAMDTRLDVRVALKVLPPEAARNERLLERLRKEVILGRRVTHPNVCRLHDFGRDGEVHFVTMEFIEGETLLRRMARGPMAPDRAVHVLLQICGALEAAHAHGVIHRDLKPANIMIGPDDKVSVMDFGLARDLLSQEVSEQMLVGTPAYWSPEQAQGERGSPLSDIYALGLVGTELFGGRRERWNAPAKLEGVPARVVPVLERCLKVKQDERFESVAEVREALRRAHHGERRRPYRKRFLIVALLVGVLAGGALVFGLVSSGGAPAAHRVVVQVRVTPAEATIADGDTELGRGVADVELEADDGRRMLRVTHPGYVTHEASVGVDDAPVLEIRLEPR